MAKKSNSACEVKDIVKASKLVSKAVSIGSVLPEYGCIQLEIGKGLTSKDRSALSAYNGIMGVRCEFPLKGSPCALIMGAEKFLKYFSSFDSGANDLVEVSQTDKNVVFEIGTGGKLTVPRMTMNTPFHKISSGNKIASLDSYFFDACSYILAGAGSDEARPVTTNAKLDFDAGLVWVTSGVALEEYRLKTRVPGLTVVVPNVFLAAALSAYETVWEEMDLYSAKSSLLVATKDRSLIVEYLYSSYVYPDFAPMLAPYRKPKMWYTVLREDFISRFNRIGSLISEKDKQFDLRYIGKGSKLEMVCSMTDATHVVESMKCAGSSDMTITFNHEYVKPYVDAITKSSGDNIRIGLTPGEKGIVFETDDPMLYVVLPIAVTK